MGPDPPLEPISDPTVHDELLAALPPIVPDTKYHGEPEGDPRRPGKAKALSAKEKKYINTKRKGRPLPWE